MLYRFLLRRGSSTLNMYLFTITLLIISNVIISYGSYSKCCQFGEYLLESNSSYECVENVQKRLDILTNDTDFLGRKLDGECAEVSTDFFIFNVSDGRVLGKRPVTEDYFPKCCPLNYTYNSVLHSCNEGQPVTPKFIKDNFIKVGLSNCKIIEENYYDLITEPRKKLLRHSQHLRGAYCIDENEEGLNVIRECKHTLEICEEIRCIKKCCPDGQSFINGVKCYNTYTHGLNLSAFPVIEEPEDPYVIIFNRTCPGIYMLRDKDTFSLDRNGVFRYWTNSTDSPLEVQEDIGNTGSYCIEYTKKTNIEGYFFFKCFAEKHEHNAEHNEEKFQYIIWAKILSCISLVLTIIIYLILNKTKKIFGKMLINYCVVLLLENAVLTYAQMNLRPTDIDCKLRSFSIIFFVTAAFSWSNALCCDIWWTLGSTKRTFGPYQRKRDLRRLCLYSLYGWGVPTIQTFIIFLFYSNGVLPFVIHPFLATAKCSFEDRNRNYAHALLFNISHLIMQIVNIVLFQKTVSYYLKMKNEINNINDSIQDDKDRELQKAKGRSYLILKLSVIMAVSFVFEVVSAFFDLSEMGVVPKYIQIVWDSVNCLQGIFIFIIFICKRKIYRDFLLKCNVLPPGLPASGSTSSIYTESTTASNDESNSISMNALLASNENEENI